MVEIWNWIPVGTDVGPQGICNRSGIQLARDYHGRRIAAGDGPKAAAQRELQGSGVACLNNAVQFALTCVDRNAKQGLQQASADAQSAESGQDHERKFGSGAFSYILGMADHLAVRVRGQHHDPIALIDGLDTAQQGLVGRISVREMALVKTVAVHRGEEAGNAITIVRVGGTQVDRQVGGPWLARAHGRSPAMKSVAADITVGSSRTRR
jgi:hypothetical protein